MTTIKLLERNALSITLFNAMCRQIQEGENILEHFSLEANGDVTTAELKILVNGVEIDIIPELVGFIESIDQQFEEAVENKAKELIMKDQTLFELACAIQNAEYAIQKRLNKVLQQSN